MKKSDLRTGMIVTLRNGIEFIVYKDIETNDPFAEKDVLLKRDNRYEK